MGVEKPRQRCPPGLKQGLQLAAASGLKGSSVMRTLRGGGHRRWRCQPALALALAEPPKKKARLGRAGSSRWRRRQRRVPTTLASTGVAVASCSTPVAVPVWKSRLPVAVSPELLEKLKAPVLALVMLTAQGK